MIFRVSNLEDFRKFEQDEEYPFGVFMNRLVGKEPPSEAMLAGTALHKFLEMVGEGLEFDSVEIGGCEFIFEKDFLLSIKQIKEIRLSKTYNCFGKDLIVSGCVDVLDNLTIEDHKTTSSFDPDRYLEGYQWRFYLDIFKANRFVWNVFEMREDTKTPKTYYITQLHTLEQYRYPSLESDCQALVERFSKFIEREDVSEYLRRNNVQ